MKQSIKEEIGKSQIENWLSDLIEEKPWGKSTNGSARTDLIGIALSAIEQTTVESKDIEELVSNLFILKDDYILNQGIPLGKQPEKVQKATEYLNSEEAIKALNQITDIKEAMEAALKAGADTIGGSTEKIYTADSFPDGLRDSQFYKDAIEDGWKFVNKLYLNGRNAKNMPVGKDGFALNELKKFIKKLLKEFKGSPYGHTTLTTRDSGVMHSRFTRTGRPPGIMQEEGASWGLEPRQIDDSFTFEELEQLKKYKKISPEDYNGAVGYLQAWADQHPNFLKQRDLNTSSRQEIRNKYEMGSIKIIELIVEYELKDLNKMKDNALLAQDQYVGNDVDSDKFGNEFYDMEIPELDGYSLRDVEDAINFIQPSQPSYTYDQAIGRAPLPDGRYLDKDGNKTTVAPNKDAFTKSSNFDRNEPLNEMTPERGAKIKQGYDRKKIDVDILVAKDQDSIQDKATNTQRVQMGQQHDKAEKAESQAYEAKKEAKLKYEAAKAELRRLKVDQEMDPLEKNKLVRETEEIYKNLKKEYNTASEGYVKAKEATSAALAGLSGVSAAASKANQAHKKALQLLNKQKDQIGKAVKGGTSPKIAELFLRQYINLRKDNNLMEQMDSYRRKILIENTMQKFFKLFDKEKTDEEVLRYYASLGVVVPEPFIKKARDQYKNLKKAKLDIEFAEQEAKDFKSVKKEEPQELKKMTSRLFKEDFEYSTERKFKVPTEILDALQKLKLNPINRFVKNFKAVNSIPPSYRVFLHNGQTFDIIYEEFSLMIKIGTKEYYIADLEERNTAIKHINKLLTGKTIKPKDEEEEEIETPLPPTSPSSPPSSPPPVDDDLDEM